MEMGRMLGRNTLLGASLAILTAAPLWADVKAGVDAWTRGDFAAATAAWKGLAERGDPDAQFNLGQAYKLGRGVKQDLAKAEELFGKAAAQGHLQASDNFGLLLFQRGERARALPFISAAADRGEPRAQYLLGIATFNGDNVPKDWVRAYALVSLAQQAGLPQATAALGQMDQYIPLDQRQRSVVLARELGTQAEATRARQLASADLGAAVPDTPGAPVVTALPRVPPAVAVASPPMSIPRESPREAGADYARPRAPAAPQTAPVPRASTPRAPEVAPSVAAAPASGGWRVQLGAFGVASNADALWSRVRSRPELAGRARITVPAGRVTKLQAGGFGSEGAAKDACAGLAAAGFACIAVRN